MNTPQKTIILLEHHGGRLGNQLWPFMSLYAYCLERGYELRNYCFPYSEDYTFPVGHWLIKLLFHTSLKNISFRKWSPVRHWLYPQYVRFIKQKYGDKIIDDQKEVDEWKPFYLPPSTVTNPRQRSLIERAETSPDRKIYITGWMYRNPVGIEKYRAQILSYFQPKQRVQDYVVATLKEPRSQFKRVVGVHLRLGDYRYVEDKQFFFEPTVVRKFMDEYVAFSGLKNEEVCFLICSDEDLDPKLFTGLNVYLPKGNPTDDLFTLAATDVIIGSNSTFAPFAAYYGNIPFIMFERSGIEWEYYRGKTTYFQTKKPSRVFF